MKQLAVQRQFRLALRLGLGCQVVGFQGLRFGVRDFGTSGFGDLGFRVRGWGFGVEGLGFGV